jgi:hypothetical protein
MRNFLIPFFVLLAAFAAMSQSSPTKEQAAVVDAAQKAALQAVNFSQGDAEALKRARRNFTPEGWDDFMKHMTGFVDKNGAPAFSSSFEPSGSAVVIGQENGAIRFKVPGTLTQAQGKLSKTTYKNATIDVEATGNPPKISHLEQIYSVH